MKLSTSIFALIASSVVYAYNTNDVLNILNKRQQLHTDYSQFNDIPNECRLAINEYVECSITPSEKTYDNDCSIFASDKCQKFYKDPLSVAPSCKGVSLIEKDLVSVLEASTLSLSFACQKDEVGNYCPLSSLLVKNSYYIKTSEYEKIKENTCQSKICREAAYEFFSKTAEMYQTIDDTDVFNVSNTQASVKESKELSEYLNSDKCKAMSSGASTLKIGSGLLISLGLLLLSLY